MLYTASVVGGWLSFSVKQMQNQYRKSACDRIKWIKHLTKREMIVISGHEAVGINIF